MNERTARRWSPWILLGAVGLGVCAVFAHDMKRARDRLRGSSLLPTTFGALEYASVGAGEPILVIHGAGGGFDQALEMTGALVGARYRLIVPSRFGYLRSELPSRATAEMQADAYVELLDHLGLGQVAVVGISAGAWSALQFALRHPERCRALVLLVPANYLPLGMSIHGGILTKAILGSNFLAWLTVQLAPVLPGNVVTMLLGTDAAVLRTAAPAERARVGQILEHLLPVDERSEGMQLDVRTAATQEPFPFEGVRCPVLAISAADDRFDTAERARDIAARVPRGRAIIFPKGGHALVGDTAGALREAVAFLREQPVAHSPGR